MKVAKQFLWALIPGSFVLGLSGCIQAPDTGAWSGQAVYRDGFRDATTCNLKLDLTHTDEYVRVHSIESDCNVYKTRWQAGTFERHGDTLWRDGRIVGHADDAGSVSLNLEHPYQDDDYPFTANRVTVSWTRVGNYLEYTEEAYFDNKIQRTHAWLTESHRGE